MLTSPASTRHAPQDLQLLRVLLRHLRPLCDTQLHIADDVRLPARQKRAKARADVIQLLAAGVGVNHLRAQKMSAARQAGELHCVSAARTIERSMRGLTTFLMCSHSSGVIKP